MSAELAVISQIRKKPKVQEFLTSGTWVRPPGVDAVQVFLVAGGGGGGATADGGSNRSAGGGGGGGEVIDTYISVATLTGDLSITIGAGGVGGTTGTTTTGDHGTKGGDSTISGTGITTLTAEGGGFGTGAGGLTPETGGCGGGAGSPVRSEASAGGGGGMGSNALGFFYTGSSSTVNAVYFLRHNGRGSAGGHGAQDGVQMAMHGGLGYKGFAGGGAGGCPTHTFGHSGGGNTTANQAGGNALPNSGSGGGGGSTSDANFRAGGNGGSGYCKIIWWE